jgi:hypothetical protein
MRRQNTLWLVRAILQVRGGIPPLTPAVGGDVGFTVGTILANDTIPAKLGMDKPMRESASERLSLCLAANSA